VLEKHIEEEQHRDLLILSFPKGARIFFLLALLLVAYVPKGTLLSSRLARRKNLSGQYSVMFTERAPGTTTKEY